MKTKYDPVEQEELRSPGLLVLWILIGFGLACFLVGYIVAKIIFGG